MLIRAFQNQIRRGRHTTRLQRSTAQRERKFMKGAGSASWMRTEREPPRAPRIEPHIHGVSAAPVAITVGLVPDPEQAVVQE